MGLLHPTGPAGVSVPCKIAEGSSSAPATSANPPARVIRFTGFSLCPLLPFRRGLFGRTLLIPGRLAALQPRRGLLGDRKLLIQRRFQLRVDGSLPLGQRTRVNGPLLLEILHYVQQSAVGIELQ